ncbi:hypothetical protein [Spongiivirga citrea]|uniref:Viral A-type inclusion protein n=1 Tax=Spongiivirga citrea TaxID=1481457 RepID=A0A6M0CTA5_9FLAO|nr:hypothetical protein [Spongiivirga citrea]NER17030.1 hypothetical protein [Spongiivirga citrea]
MKNSFLLLATFLLVFVSCKKKEDTKKTPELTQMQRVMEVHDEVMPEMGTIGRLIKQLESQPDSISSKTEYKNAVADLKDAHDYMMTWMGDFSKRFDYDESMKGKPLSEEKKVWLNEEEEKVKIMRDKVVNSIANAKTLLGN